MQVVEEAEQPLSEYYRHISKGAWPFSTRDHGWPISDCSSEGLKAALSLAKLPADMVGRYSLIFRLTELVQTSHLLDTAHVKYMDYSYGIGLP
eukprot:scaffold69099_cov21-Tisochrysis_lutea.AAC.1